MTETTRVKKDELDVIDQAALDLAVTLVLEEDPDMAHIVRSNLQDGLWWEAGTFACYCRQMDYLQLEPHESPPCWIGEDDIDDIIAAGAGDRNSEYGSALLLQKMIALGVSKFDPRPIDSMAAAQRSRKQRR